MSGNSISRKRASKAIYLLTGSVVLIVAAFLVLALTNTALTQSMMGDKDSLTGQIVAVDDSHNLKTLTIISDELGKYPTDTITIFLSKGTDVKLCTMNDPAEESMVTRDVTIEYHEVSGLAVADSVSEQC
ncbi:MAG TPA: hypothetical protein VEJ22_00930 [Nitrospirota bacterium]|nr:hypothetical protein [Nitrospirota bacterium]